MVKAAEANAEYLEQLLPEYRERPQIVLQRIYQKAVEQVMENADEKIFVQPDVSEAGKELRVLINKKPKTVKPEQKGEQTE